MLKLADSVELAEADFLRWGEDPNKEFASYYIRNSKVEIHDWMTALGTEFINVSPNGAGNSVARFHSPRGQGLGLVIPVYREILGQGGVTFLLNTRVTGLRTDKGRVVGVSTLNLRTGEKGQQDGGAVLLSTGGFAANLDLVRASWPKHMAVPDRVLVGGGFFATGNGMDLAKSAGGESSRLDHQWNYASGLPDPFDPEGKRGFFSMSFGAIWVNAQGKRFVLEQHEPKATIPVIAAQKPARYWAIFDAEGRKGFRVVHAGFTQDRVEALFNVPALIRRGDTLADLARAAELPVDALVATVERYNGMVDAGADVHPHPQEHGRHQRRSRVPCAGPGGKAGSGPARRGRGHRLRRRQRKPRDGGHVPRPVDPDGPNGRPDRRRDGEAHRRAPSDRRPANRASRRRSEAGSRLQVVPQPAQAAGHLPARPLAFRARPQAGARAQTELHGLPFGTGPVQGRLAPDQPGVPDRRLPALPHEPAIRRTQAGGA
jgi:hypothetical protein